MTATFGQFLANFRFSGALVISYFDKLNYLFCCSLIYVGRVPLTSMILLSAQSLCVTLQKTKSKKSSIRIVQCAVWNVKCELCNLQCVVCSVQCEVCSFLCTLCSLQCAGFSMQSAVSIMQCALCSEQYAVCSVYRAVSSVQ